MRVSNWGTNWHGWAWYYLFINQFVTHGSLWREPAYAGAIHVWVGRSVLKARHPPPFLSVCAIVHLCMFPDETSPSPWLHAQTVHVWLRGWFGCYIRKYWLVQCVNEVVFLFCVCVHSCMCVHKRGLDIKAQWFHGLISMMVMPFSNMSQSILIWCKMPLVL